MRRIAIYRVEANHRPASMEAQRERTAHNDDITTSGHRRTSAFAGVSTLNVSRCATCSHNEGEPMVTWVLVEEPDALVAKAIEIVEARLGSDEEVVWLSPAGETQD
jgi:hypothetical protein